MLLFFFFLLLLSLPSLKTLMDKCCVPRTKASSIKNYTNTSDMQILVSFILQEYFFIKFFFFKFYSFVFVIIVLVLSTQENNFGRFQKVFLLFSLVLERYRNKEKEETKVKRCYVLLTQE